MSSPDDETVSAPRRGDSTPATDPGAASDPVTQKQSGTPPSRTPSPLPDVPGYTASRKLGEGGMGVVYAADDPTLGREVAVKVMHAGQDAGRFVVESRVTAQLPHPGVPPVYALGELPDGRPFLAMKLVEGRTLSDELKRPDRRTELPRLLGVFERICETVGFAHAKNIVHRDLKPANVMVGAFGEVLVMDWGLAKHLSGQREPLVDSDAQGTNAPLSGDETEAGAIKGTPAYMAPEQARGEPVDARADVFALGGILATALTGRPPFVGATVLEAVARAARADLADCFAELGACGADANLVAVTKTCLAATPAERYASGTEVAAAVSAYRAGVEERLRAAERERAAADARATEQRKKRRAQLALAAALFLMAAGAGAGAWYYQWQAARQRLKAEQARASVRAGLDTAAGQRRQYRFDDARATLAQAAAAARRDAPELLPEVERARDDLEFVIKLDDIRFRKWQPIVSRGGKGRFNTDAGPPAYRQEFADRGLDVTALPTEQAAARIVNSTVKAELVAALGDWAVYETDTAVRARLLAVAVAADPDPWRDRLRAAIGRPNKAVAAELARDADPAAVPPPALVALAELMRQTGGDQGPLLTAARAAHTADFELALALGQSRPLGSAARVGAFEAARALRPDNLAVWINLSNALGEAGDSEGELAACRKVLALAPHLSLAHDNYGIALYARGDLAGAVAAYTRAIELDPRHAAPYSNRGMVAYDRGEYDAAVRDYTKAIELDPKFAPAHNNLANALLARGDVAGAAAAVRRALELDPQNINARNNLGNVLSAQGDAAGAVREYRAALRAESTNSMLHTNLGDALRVLKDYPAAVARHRVAIDLKPDFAMAHFNLGVVLAEVGDRAGAIAAYRDAIRVNPREPKAHNNLGAVLAASGDSAGAIAAYRDAIRIDPKFGIAYSNLGKELAATGDTDGAIAEYKRAIVADPRDATAHANLGGTLNQTGDARGALAALDHAIKLNPKLALAHSNRGAALSGLGDLDGAVAAYRRALEIEPNNAGFYYNLATAYVKQNKYPETVASARRAAELDPKDASSHAILGFALGRTGDLTGARAALAEAARLDRRFAGMLAALPPEPKMPPPREPNRP